ncbi:MAG: hypothetical protein COU07_01960 [Candidatus Harrisonbacteria bacterium CG10_big_fil_rev_8_21_14_0_10_40_38]|uniref:Proline--tRNA ligase n=1 Tax=Candidatus Harrisonbacteria bacterium CG10_big_fil_rev_8_21_14_0_10_40_38 TaxID=1974583 RepID=A0A2H0USC4_9BACT|nr:MAG: hypothetical protein COU07_01960 [Candidatus Harrisonbacteria bacterium CG10_big_fil_rev_8_21_14_0_10_40_38]
MLQSNLFTDAARQFPEGEETANAKYLIRGGFISKASAGVYSILPLGLRVLNNIVQIIREEMNDLGAEELLMPALVEKKYWEKSKRWDTDIIYKTGKSSNAHDFEYGLGWTHEEVIAAIAVNYIQSYKDLPSAVYQFQNKFRAEVRAQGGLLRGREFLMKDLYSFHVDSEDLNKFYAKVAKAYSKAFKRLGLKAMMVEASGGAFTKEYTHEFQVIHPVGEDIVYHCDKCSFAQNKEIYKPEHHADCSGKISESRAIEVGNIFRLGTRFSDSFGLTYLNSKGERLPVVMGSYGIGPTRVMGTLVEVYHDDKGIIWPESVAPFKVHVIDVSRDKKITAGKKVYDALQKAAIPVLYDDRTELRAGEKFATSDLLGIPYRVVVSEKTGSKVELKKRTQNSLKIVTQAELIRLVSSK